jgi:hypothetical protein
MHEFWISGSQARVDMVFAACIAVALAGFFFWYRDGHRRARDLLCSQRQPHEQSQENYNKE